MGNKKRIPLGGAPILAVMLLLPGCLPLPLSLALDGVSYAASGKSIGDHLISGLTQKDCSFGRALIYQSDLCQDWVDETIIVDSLSEDQDLDISTASADDFVAGEE